MDKPQVWAELMPALALTRLWMSWWRPEAMGVYRGLGLMFCQDQRAQAGQDNSRIIACQRTIAFPQRRRSGQHLKSCFSPQKPSREKIFYDTNRLMDWALRDSMCLCAFIRQTFHQILYLQACRLPFVRVSVLLVCVWVCLSVLLCTCSLAYLHVGGFRLVICHLRVTASENCKAQTCRYNYKIDSHDSRLRWKFLEVTWSGIEKNNAERKIQLWLNWHAIHLIHQMRSN